MRGRRTGSRGWKARRSSSQRRRRTRNRIRRPTFRQSHLADQMSRINMVAWCTLKENTPCHSQRCRAARERATRVRSPSRRLQCWLKEIRLSTLIEVAHFVLKLQNEISIDGSMGSNSKLTHQRHHDLWQQPLA